MSEIINSLHYIIPALIVFATSYFINRGFFKKEENRLKQEAILNNQKTITQVRLQAYERICMFIERINPELLIIRLNNRGINNSQLQQLLLQNIRQEWEHNLSQQIYVSTKTWELAKSVKENTIKLINTKAASVNPNNISMEVCTKILEAYNEESSRYSKKAIENIREEIQTLMY